MKKARGRRKAAPFDQGGTRKIGDAIALMFAEFGAKLMVSDCHQEECDAAAEQIDDLGGQPIAAMLF